VIILSQELAAANPHEVSFNSLILFILVSEIIHISIKHNNDVWSLIFTFSNSFINKNFGVILESLSAIPA
jgi:hypothetical protein